jgi:hypothetical protein
MALNRTWIPSPNYSSRGGTAVTCIVLHTAEGCRDYVSLGNFFANPASGVSSQTGIDDTPGEIGEYLTRDAKPWTQGNANPYCVSAELCAFAEWDDAEWHRHPNMLANTAAWIAEEAAHFGIPIVALDDAGAQGGAAGVCQHVNLGAAGGGHWDCGPGFPMAEVLDMARGGAGAPVPPPVASAPPPLEVPDMIAPPLTFTLDAVQQAFYVDADGDLVHCYARPGQPWTRETLGGGWDPDSGLAHDVGHGNAAQVWGVRADGKRAQCYWAGTRWVTQPLP